MIQCTFENGSGGSKRHVTAGAIVVDGDNILLARRADHMMLEGGKWGLPGGFLDRDETVAEGVEREILEETGYKASNLRLLVVNTNPDRPHEDRQNVDFVFVADVGDKIQEPDDETSEIKWFNKTELPDELEIAFDYAESLKWYLEHPDLELRLIGLSL